MWLYYLLKTMSTVISWLPYKAVVVIGKGMGHLYHKIAKKQRVRAEETIRERLGYSQEQAEATIKSLFVKLGITFMEIMYMPALNKDNIRGLVTFDRPEVLWDALKEKHGVVMLACHMDNWEWLGAALALNGFPQPYHPVFNVERFTLASSDKFFLVIEAEDAHFTKDQTNAFLQGLGAKGVYDVAH